MTFSDDLQRALEDMRYERERVEALVTPLSPADLERARPGGWTLRRVLRHLIESEAIFAKLLAYQCGRAAPEPSLAAPSDGAAARDALAQTRSAALSMIDAIDESTLYRLVTFGHEEFSALSVLENIALHDREHAPQIAELATPLRSAGPRTGQVTTRAARADDLEQLTAIYNHYVRSSPATFDIDPFSVEQRRDWFSHYAAVGPHRLLVAEARGGVVGYAGSSQFRPKPAYDTTVEVTVYCAAEATGRGIGTLLYDALFEALAGEDLHMAVAGITVPNPASVELHRRFGFVLAGVMHGIGLKFGRYWDVGWYEKRLRDAPATALGFAIG